MKRRQDTVWIKDCTSALDRPFSGNKIVLQGEHNLEIGNEGVGKEKQVQDRTGYAGNLSVKIGQDPNYPEIVLNRFNFARVLGLAKERGCLDPLKVVFKLTELKSES